MRITLETETGLKLKEIADKEGILQRLLPANTDISFPLLRFVDRYGDTVFNQLQMDQFLSEWGSVKARATSQERALIGQVEDMAIECKQGMHKYIRFYGD